MAVEIVTGFTGSFHVTPSQDGARDAGLAGKGAYIMDVGNKCVASMTSSNVCHVEDGYICAHGRIFAITDTDLTIANGTASQKRNDLVVLRYSRASAASGATLGVESASLVVIQGTAGTTAADPSTNGGSILDGDATVDIVLYRVALDGLTVSAPVQVIEDMWSLAKLRDSISPTTINLDLAEVICAAFITSAKNNLHMFVPCDPKGLTRAGFSTLPTIGVRGDSASTITLTNYPTWAGAVLCKNGIRLTATGLSTTLSSMSNNIPASVEFLSGVLTIY